jgi:hypothetical protein
MPDGDSSRDRQGSARLERGDLLAAIENMHPDCFGVARVSMSRTGFRLAQLCSIQYRNALLSACRSCRIALLLRGAVPGARLDEGLHFCPSGRSGGGSSRWQRVNGGVERLPFGAQDADGILNR